MLRDPSVKYRPFPQVQLTDRQWPSKTITKAPRWLSTDLRDGNQALADPMNAEKKQRFFDLLVGIGAKEIEVGFPSAGATEFDFIRSLIEQGRVPDDVMIQVLTQSRRDLIERSFESLEGARAATVHLYNAVSPVWREVVFGLDRAGVKALAVEGVSIMREQAERRPGTDWRYEYSPETFSTAELEFSLEVCEAVLDVLQPTPEKPVILNLPATVEASSPNIYADQIEWMCRHISRRDSVVISLHPHNDRGTGVAAAELGLMAGADRIEGCLFGNGERTGNVDLVTLALNLYTQGVDPGLDFSDMETVVKTVEYCNQLPVHPRHPYAGELVFTAFSGSHQDAIKKGFDAQAKRNDQLWAMPYLPIDPADLGGSYEAVIRVNSQSGKGGVAWVLQQDKGLRLPKPMQAHFSRAVQQLADETSRELATADIWEAFQQAYHLTPGQRFELVSFEESGVSRVDHQRVFVGQLRLDGREMTIRGRGNGLISGLLAALAGDCGVRLDVADFQEHAIGAGSDAMAAAYVQCRTPDGRTVFGVGMDADVATASVRAVLSAANGV
ncbi:2-isopropylmalate synthase [Phenylobacterium sp. Root77]|jgi:2-isopropylmalate synthase|uniref:2-isopropylmalate synthase n=1 Tax=unclassified Phenylobacterium TaxID=2640670 RepID=UPI0006FE51D3|nr:MULTISPECIES: 2-isopropylmalate synthase [unclassified Phenylobacterium]KQW70616.1 2-isopropylmalate synthase [Phenylobacterium sp. Root1277]KQW90964.1 2-isopropylmalate synthase [Phenylobacterium sp. Root1290]KRC39404.1 2-isopropylmalate synthase [Phenylobacterium sp. Root77]